MLYAKISILFETLLCSSLHEVTVLVIFMSERLLTSQYKWKISMYNKVYVQLFFFNVFVCLFMLQHEF